MTSAAKTINNNILDDDDSENDSDYCPENDPEADNEVEDTVQETKLSVISFGRKRKVDDVWATMQEETSSSKTTSNFSSSSNSSRSSKKKAGSKKNKDILAAIFGKKQSGKIIDGISSKTPGTKADELRIKEAARESVRMLRKKTVVTETRKFAGQEIIIERTIMGPGSGGNSKVDASITKASALDCVLDSIKGPKIVSTVAKSGYDWDAYKEKEGLEDDLAAASKEGFLTRKDFLQRCDYRAYEQERDDRLMKSSANPK